MTRRLIIVNSSIQIKNREKCCYINAQDGPELDYEISSGTYWLSMLPFPSCVFGGKKSLFELPSFNMLTIKLYAN